MNDNNVLNKKSIKIIIPIIVLLVLLIVAFIYLREYKYNNYRNKQTYEFYQYALYSVAVHKDRHVDYVKEGIDCRNMMWVCQADQTKTN